MTTKTFTTDTTHVVAIGRTGLPGEWTTHCPGCEAVTGEAVAICRVYPEEWPESGVLCEVVVWP